MEIVVLLILVGGIGLIGWGFVAFIRALTTPGPPLTTSMPSQQDPDDLDGMNEGDYHNGPGGYSPMTGYPDTFYGGGHEDDEGDER